MSTSKTILITGASTGFGRDTAETLARAGHTVFASMRDTQAKNRKHANELHKQGINVVELDVSSDASVEKAIAEVLATVRTIDVRGVYPGPGEGHLQHERGWVAAREPRRAACDAQTARRIDHQHRLDSRPGNLPILRDLWSEQVRGLGADR
jgi:NAD(P)-dependent dehydrogenase (short-subunit alcohol dehydrogenase family)